MNKELTLVFNSYQSQHLLNRILVDLQKNFRVIVIENSLDKRIKLTLEKKFKNVKVIIPKKNLGLAKSYNLAIKRAKTKYVFLNNPDIEINKKSILNLLKCAKNIKDFSIISPVYKMEKDYKNYEIFTKKNNVKSKIFKKFDIREVDLIDNNFLIKKNNLQIFFDEKFFLYFETIDLAHNLRKNKKKLYITNKIKFHHYGSSSLPPKLNNLVKKTRAFHYNWSKFYFYKKNYNYFYAIRKIFPNFIKSIKKIIISLIRFNYEYFKLGFLELLGILTAVICIHSFYRPNK